jgi:hypothetical protein
MGMPPTANRTIAVMAVGVTAVKTLPPMTLLANDSKSREGENMIRWGRRTTEEEQAEQGKKKMEDSSVDVSPSNRTYSSGNDACSACGLSQRLTGDAATR